VPTSTGSEATIIAMTLTALSRRARSQLGPSLADGHRRSESALDVERRDDSWKGRSTRARGIARARERAAAPLRDAETPYD
jgi:hypothetical protein